MNMRIFGIVILQFILPLYIIAQDQTSLKDSLELNWRAFMDSYYAYDFDKPIGIRHDFLYNHNRHNEVNLNLALIQFDVSHKKYRASLGIQAGNYAQDNYAAEEELLRSIHTANIGVALSKKNIVWLDIGILPSHIGFESAISADNLTLTRSLCAENSPYYEAGAKISYRTENKKWSIAALILNGWQRIKRVPNNSLISYGTHIGYDHSEHFHVQWNTFIGTDRPDDMRRMRYFSNVYAQFDIGKNIHSIIGLDVGMEETSLGSSAFNRWIGPVAIIQFKPAPSWAFALRMEHYHDENGVIIKAGNNNRFSAYGYSANVDFRPYSNLVYRLECRYFDSKYDLNSDLQRVDHHNIFLITSVSVDIHSAKSIFLN